MKVIVRYSFILGLICILSGGLLAVVNSLTQPEIAARAKQEEEKTLSEVLPQASRFEPVKSAGGEVIYHKAYSKDNRLVGVAFKASGKGYSGMVETMAGMTMDGKISAIKILSQNETPGLGNRITESSFLAQFSKKDIPGLAQVQAITGATVSSRAVMDSVKQKAEEIKRLIKDEPR